MLSNLGFSEILIIAIVALVIFGPNKLPQMGRSVGQAIREFKKATQSITEEVTKAATEEIAEKKDSSEKKA
ncbi:MAG: Sec-independent protein translocase protein TatB [Bacillota bacterium]